MRSLTRGERKSLAYHREVAKRLQANPALLDLARARIDWYRAKNPHGEPYYDAWAKLLNGPISALLEMLVSESDDACALRQENPFVDLIDQRERARIYQSVVDAIDREVRA